MNYTDTEFLTAKEKEKVARDWERFMKFLADGKHLAHNADNGGSDYGHESPKEFTKALYNHLHLHCGYIAHYNQHGFYTTYFGGDEQDLERFFGNFTKTDWGGYPTTCAWGDYKDIGETMCDVYAKYKSKIFKQASENTDSQFELVRECVKRAETDMDFRKQIISKFLN